MVLAGGKVCKQTSEDASTLYNSCRKSEHICAQHGTGNVSIEATQSYCKGSCISAVTGFPSSIKGYVVIPTCLCKELSHPNVLWCVLQAPRGRLRQVVEADMTMVACDAAWKACCCTNAASLAIALCCISADIACTMLSANVFTFSTKIYKVLLSSESRLHTLPPASAITYQS